MQPKTPATKLPTYRVPRELHARAEAEATRQRKQTGEPVTWQQIVRRALNNHLPK